MPTPEVYFDTREAAAALGVNERTILRWIDSGRITPIKPRKGLVFTGTEVGRVARLPRPPRGGYRQRRHRPPQAETLPEVS